MRGKQEASRRLFSYVDLEGRAPSKHPLRLVNDALASLARHVSGEQRIAVLVEHSGHPSWVTYSRADESTEQ